MFRQICFFVSITCLIAVFNSVSAEEPTVAEKKRLQSYEIVKKRNRDDGHLPTKITGQALLPDGSPAIGFKIDGWSRSGLHENYGDDFFDAVTDENGRFTLELWRPYLYWIRITDPKGVYVAFDQHFALKEPPTSDIIRFQLQKGIPVEGTIIDRNTGKPIVDFPVWLIHNPIFTSIRELGLEKYYEYEKKQQMPHQVHTDSEGKFRFTALPSEYLVSLCDCYGIFRPIPKEELDVYARFVTVKEEAIHVHLDIPTPWRGRVLQKDGSPAAFYPVELVASLIGGEYITDQEGYFTVFMSPKVERITIDTSEQGQCFFKQYDKEVLPQGYVVQLTAPVSAKGQLIRKSTGKPLACFKFASRPRPYCTDIIETDENGFFELNGLFSNSKTNLCFLNEPDSFDACAIFQTFKSFVPDETENPVNLGILELEESGWIEPNFLDNLPGKTIEIEGTTLDGKAFDWKKYRGKVVLVEFWATWCGPCLQEIPHLKTVYEKYHSRGFEIVGISVDEDLKALEKGLTKHEFPWPVLADQKWKDSGKPGMYDRFAVRGVPRGILVNRDGKVITIETRGEKLDTELKKLFPD